MENKISTLKELEEIEKKYDPQLSFREIGSKLNFIIFILLISMSIYHFWASGFGLVREVLHRGIHISYVIGLVFLLFSWKKNITKISFLHFQNVPIIDIIFAILVIVSALYLPLLPSEVLAQRVGNPENFICFIWTPCSGSIKAWRNQLAWFCKSHLYNKSRCLRDCCWSYGAICFFIYSIWSIGY